MTSIAGPMVPQRRRPVRLAAASLPTGLLCAAAIVIPATAAHADVIEIGDQGEIVIHSAENRAVASGETPSPRAARLSAGLDAYEQTIARAAHDQAIPVALLAAVAWQESRGRQDAISPAGAIGIMQLMPDTAREVGVDPHVPDENIRGGAIYLARQIRNFGNVRLALAAYNAGPGAVARYRGIPPFAETRAYVDAVLARWSTNEAGAGMVNARAEKADQQPPFLIEVPAP